MNSLLIIGGTGVLGNATARHFLKRGFRVKAFVRNKVKAASLEMAGAEIIQGDLSSPDSLKGICKDVDIVLTAAHGMLGKGRNKSATIDHNAHKQLIDEAKKTGVKHFIYTSVFGVSPEHPVDFLRTKYVIEQYLQQSGVTYTILRLPAFMEWHVHTLLGKNIVEKGKTTILGRGENPINFIAVNDVVQALDKIAGNPEFFNRIINIAGPDNLTRNEVSQIYGRLLNIKPRVGHVPVGMLKVLSVLFQPFHPGIARIMKFSVYTDKSNESMNENDSIRQFGLDPTTVETFVRNKLAMMEPVVV